MSAGGQESFAENIGIDEIEETNKLLFLINIHVTGVTFISRFESFGSTAIRKQQALPL